ncbi:CobW family GTP-binding protein [Brevibacterium otitidis]|uniref:CobW family GTP-binding protein n=1 Tax=Brevibacterium otitidis TaxID=53364 RepID=A0ABV5WZC1_9MICO|nr:GTP-binding protein [Brevibacterium otitidis]BFF08600.1 GTP-binding protein [Brevibacterium otitidis]
MSAPAAADAQGVSRSGARRSGAGRSGGPRSGARLGIIGGYLGAGKSTLVNRLLAGILPGRTAVVVNDFGTVNIDAALIAAASDDTIELTNGCICCQISDDALRTMSALAARDDLDQVLCEVSGVGNPGQLAVWRSYPGFSAGPVLVCADATAITSQLADLYVGDAVAGQLAAAEVVLVTKTDLASPAQVEAAVAACRQAAGQAVIVVQDPDDPDATAAEALRTPVPEAAGRARQPAGGPAPQAAEASGPDTAGGPAPEASAPNRRAHDAAASFHAAAHATATVEITGPVGLEALTGVLDTLAGTLVRAKGIVPTASGTAHSVQLSGRRIDVRPTDRPATDGFVLIAAGADPQAAVDAAAAALAPVLTGD